MPKDSPAQLNPAIENGPGTPQDGTVRHKVVDAATGEVLESESVSTTSVHEQSVDKRVDEDEKPKRVSKKRDDADDTQGDDPRA